MSYDLRVYAVDLALVRAAVRSRDAELLSAVTRLSDGKFDPEWKDSDGRLVEWAEVFGHLIMGEGHEARLAASYVYGVEVLCAHFGRTLDDEFEMFRGIRWGRFDVIQRILDGAGVRFDVNDLVTQWPEGFGVVNDLPGIEDHVSSGFPPLVGSVEVWRLPPILRSFEAADRTAAAKVDVLRSFEAAGLGRDEALEYLETADSGDFVADGMEAVEEVTSWLRYCDEAKRDLVCFWS